MTTQASSADIWYDVTFTGSGKPRVRVENVAEQQVRGLTRVFEKDGYAVTVTRRR